ncbi:MAG TPA: hypothetical protein PKL16_11545 [Anaerolineae bacterium]|nr:hypothetical protein [Anaerolineae bacterium]HQM15067.1 hypothetical protein [Anaerolineae bacterium]
MSDHAQHQPVTIGVLAGWQFYWTATPLSYLSPVFQGICQAAQTLGCNVLLSCGMGPSATARSRQQRNDGLTLSEVWGYSLELPAGSQGAFYLDEVQLARLSTLYLPLVFRNP